MLIIKLTAKASEVFKLLSLLIKYKGNMTLGEIYESQMRTP